MNNSPNSPVSENSLPEDVSFSSDKSVSSKKPFSELRVEIPEFDVIIPEIIVPPPPQINNSSVPEFNETFFNDEEEIKIETLGSIVKLLVTVMDIDERYSIAIDVKVKSVLETFLEEESFLDDVESKIKLIVKDNKIDARDVPIILLLLAEIYEKLKNTTLSFDESLCSEILKVLFVVSIKENIITLTENEEEILQCLYSIIDTSVKLMKTKESSKKSIFTCLKSCLKDNN